MTTKTAAANAALEDRIAQAVAKTTIETLDAKFGELIEVMAADLVKSEERIAALEASMEKARAAFVALRNEMRAGTTRVGAKREAEALKYPRIPLDAYRKAKAELRAAGIAAPSDNDVLAHHHAGDALREDARARGEEIAPDDLPV